MKQVIYGAIEHRPWLEYRHIQPDGKLCVRLRAGRGDWQRVWLMYARAYMPQPLKACFGDVPMGLAWWDGEFDYFEAMVPLEDPRGRYVFRLENEGQTIYLDQDGLVPHAAWENYDPATFPLAYAYPPEPMPDWARGCVGYQVFPDRFRRAGGSESGLEPWGSDRVGSEYRFGGDLKGIREAVPYLKALGVGLVYMTPIFCSDTAHRYNTFDYYRIDPLLGDEKDLKELADALHEAGMRIILDGVFNHSGTAFAPFQDAKEKGRASAYYDWFQFDDKYACGYATFSYEPYMPKLNLRNPQAQQYFLDVGRYWIEACGVDGWRLDVSPEVWPDFWRLFRKQIKGVKPNALIVAECWDDSREWLSIGDMFDSTMHYVLSRAMWGFFAEKQLDLAAFDARINRASMLYPHAIQEVLWNFLSSHDTPRMLTRAGSLRALRTAAFFQMTHPGVPIIYYGDELGMKGGQDPYCRGAMTWDKVEGNAVLGYYRRLTQVRNSSKVLRQGAFRSLATLGDVYVYARVLGDETVVMALNTGEATEKALIPLPGKMAQETALWDALGQRRLTVIQGHVRLNLAPGVGVILTQMPA